MKKTKLIIFSLFFTSILSYAIQHVEVVKYMNCGLRNSIIHLLIKNEGAWSGDEINRYLEKVGKKWFIGFYNCHSIPSPALELYHPFDICSDALYRYIDGGWQEWVVLRKIVKDGVMYGGRYTCCFPEISWEDGQYIYISNCEGIKKMHSERMFDKLRIAFYRISKAERKSVKMMELSIINEDTRNAVFIIREKNVFMVMPYYNRDNNEGYLIIKNDIKLNEKSNCSEIVEPGIDGNDQISIDIIDNKLMILNIGHQYELKRLTTEVNISELNFDDCNKIM